MLLNGTLVEDELLDAELLELELEPLEPPLELLLLLLPHAATANASAQTATDVTDQRLTVILSSFPMRPPGQRRRALTQPAPSATV